MRPSEIADRFADARAGMTLLDYCEVGLPYWRVLARCEVLASKRISTIDETIMRAVMLGVDEVSELELFLGLDETVLESAIVGLVADERVQSTSDDRLELTEIGQGVLAAAVEIVSREQVVPLDYDGLLRRPILVDELLEPRRLRERGLREVPPFPARRPDVSELQASRQEIIRLLRSLGDGRNQESQLLAIRGFDRRDRMYRPAVAMVFAPPGPRGRVEIAFAVEDELSIEHEAAFANAGLRDRLTIERRLRAARRRPLPLPGPTAIRERVDIEAETAARDHVREARTAAESMDDEKTRAQLRQARGAFAAISPRTTQAHEHAELLDIALVTSRERLLIAGGPVSDAHIDAGFVRRLRDSLKKGTCVRIVTEGAVEGQTRGLEQLRTLARDYPALVLDEQPKTGKDRVLLSDSRFAVIGGYTWLGHLGNAHRELGDARSLLTTSSTEIDELWQRFDQRSTGGSRSSRRTRRRPRKSRRQTPPRQ
jgi:hypothetical protein